MPKEIRYRLEADMDITDLEVEYSEEEFEKAINHFRRWLADNTIFNECFFKVTYENGKEIEKIYIPF